MSTCNQLDLETLGSLTDYMPKSLSRHCIWMLINVLTYHLPKFALPIGRCYDNHPVSINPKHHVSFNTEDSLIMFDNSKFENNLLISIYRLLLLLLFLFFCFFFNLYNFIFKDNLKFYYNNYSTKSAFYVPNHGCGHLNWVLDNTLTQMGYSIHEGQWAANCMQNPWLGCKERVMVPPPYGSGFF